MQPHPVDQSVVTAGLLRRGLLIYVEPTLDEIIAGVNRKFSQGVKFSQRALQQKWDYWLGFLRNLRVNTNITTFEQGVVHFTFSDPTYDAIIERGDKITLTLSKRSVGATRYFNQSMTSDVKKNLMRMGCVLASVDGRRDVTVQDIEEASKDLYAFCISANDFVDNYVETKVLLREELQEMLLYLAEHRATNSRRAIPINKLLKQFSLMTRKPISQIKRHQLKVLKAKEFVKVKRGRNGGVFLTKEGATFAGLKVNPTRLPPTP
jgi:hypothetical protein